MFEQQPSEKEPAESDANTNEAAEDNTTKSEEKPNSPDREERQDTIHPQNEAQRTDTEPEVIRKDQL